MRCVKTHVPHVMIGLVDQDDLARRLHYLHFRVAQDVGRLLRPAFAARRRIAVAAARDLGVPLHLFRGPGLQDGIGVIADQPFENMRRVRDRTETGRRRLVIQSRASPRAGEIGNWIGALHRRRREKERRGQDEGKQAATHRTRPNRVLHELCGLRASIV